MWIISFWSYRDHWLSLIITFLACLYFVSCLLIKIRINLWTTQLSQSLLLVTWIWGYWSSLILTQTLLILSQFWVTSSFIRVSPGPRRTVEVLAVLDQFHVPVLRCLVSGNLGNFNDLFEFLLNFRWKWHLMTSLPFGVCYGTYVSCLGLFSVKIEFFDPAGFSVDKQFDLVLRTRCVKVNYEFSK